MNATAMNRWAPALLLAVWAGGARAQLKIAYIDPLSGLMAATGEHGLRELQYNAERINARGGIQGQKIEVVPMDNKLSPQESLVLLNKAIDEGIRYVMQGNGSSVAAALIDGVNKNNARNPDKSVVFLNYAAVDPDFTGPKCSFWHFRFDANSDMKLQAIMSSIVNEKSIKKVYMINQDYQFGHQVSKTAKDLLKQKRPDVELVGDELHPLAKVKDFAPYVTKIQSSGADTVITGNWGSDLALLIKAANDGGLKANFYTFYAGVVGATNAIGPAGVGRVKVVSFWGPNAKDVPAKTTKYIQDFKKKFGPGEDPYTIDMPTILEMLERAAAQAKSTDPVKVAQALEGLKVDGYFGPVEMRKDDHQLIQPLFVETFVKADAKQRNKADGTSDYGFRQDIRMEGSATARPTTCKMQRPA